MIQVSNNGLSYYQFAEDEFDGILHGFFSRNGGVSPYPWRSLNLATTVGDSRENVIENRKRIFESLSRPVKSLFDVWQVHSTNVICTDMSRDLNEPHQKADAIFTDRPEITLLMRFADCVPIILYDKSKHVVGIVHAGWQGTVNNIVHHAIAEIEHRYRVNPADIVAGIGPSIGPDHYAVGENVFQAAEGVFGKERELFFQRENGSLFFNLWQANGYLLAKAGVTKIHYSNICTACNLKDWYSHRAENGKTGRFGTVIALKE